jgi:hypothetical protein
MWMLWVAGYLIWYSVDPANQGSRYRAPRSINNLAVNYGCRLDTRLRAAYKRNSRYCHEYLIPI